MENEAKLKKIISLKSDEEKKISQARFYWAIIKRKIKVIRMMKTIGTDVIKDMSTRNNNRDGKQKENPKTPSRLIIGPNNFYNMWWNNFSQVVFLVYIMLMPLIICMSSELSEDKLTLLTCFDFTFMIDRILDLLVGFYKPNGEEEYRLAYVILNNISSKFFIEIFVIAVPIIIYQSNKNSLLYMLFKISRYSRLFELPAQIDEILEYYGDHKTVFEIRNIKYQLNIVLFITDTIINMHIFTCIQIILCTHRNYEESWMGGTGAAADDLKGQYIVAIYFVTTTLSTCGYGDISASSGDAIEAMVIMIFQFVGMLFYSSTIDKVQSFLISDDVSPNDYANSMVEVLESLIVKVGKNLP